MSPKSKRFNSELNVWETEPYSPLTLHRRLLAEQKEQWRHEVVFEENDTRRKASWSCTRAKITLKAVDETLNDDE